MLQTLLVDDPVLGYSRKNKQTGKGEWVVRTSNLQAGVLTRKLSETAEVN